MSEPLPNDGSTLPVEPNFRLLIDAAEDLTKRKFQPLLANQVGGMATACEWVEHDDSVVSIHFDAYRPKKTIESVDELIELTRSDDESDDPIDNLTYSLYVSKQSSIYYVPWELVKESQIDPEKLSRFLRKNGEMPYEYRLHYDFNGGELEWLEDRSYQVGKRAWSRVLVENVSATDAVMDVLCGDEPENFTDEDRNETVAAQTRINQALMVFDFLERATGIFCIDSEPSR